MTRLALGLVLTLIGASSALAGNVGGTPGSTLGASLGISAGESLEARQLGHPGGVRVAEVARRSAAARAGIKPGDIILQLGGDPIASVEALALSLAGREAGKPVAVKVLRDGRERILTAHPDAGSALLGAAPTRAAELEQALEVELEQALSEGAIEWSLPNGTLVARLDGGRDFAIRVDGEQPNQRLIIEVDGRVVLDTAELDDEFVIDLELE